MPQLSDHSSQYLSDSSKTSETANFQELNKPPEINDFVLIEFNTLPKNYYVEKIAKPEDADKDYEISYLPKKHLFFEFFSRVLKMWLSQTLFGNPKGPVELGNPNTCAETKLCLNFILFRLKK